MIGNENDAALAVRGMLAHLESGTDRDVYRTGNVVYKVETVEGFDYNVNENEMANIISLIPSLPDNVRIPATTLYWVGDIPVIAQEFIEGQPMADCYCVLDEPHDKSCLSEDEKALINQFINDTGGLNVIFRDGIYYIIDLGE